MRDATSTGNTGNRNTPGEWASIDATQWQTQGRRIAQEQVVYIQPAHHQPPSPCPSMAAMPIASRQVTDSNTTESVQPQKLSHVRELILPNLRIQATMDFLKEIEELINTGKPGTPETKKTCNPESAAEDAREHFNALDRMFNRMVSEFFKESRMQRDMSGKANTLPLCLIIIKETIKALDGLIEELRNTRESRSTETGTSCEHESIGKMASALHQSLQKLEADKKIWTYEDPLPLCQSIIMELSALDRVDDDDAGFTFMAKFMDPVYLIASSGALADLKRRHPFGTCLTINSFCLLVDISKHWNFNFPFGKGGTDLLFSNWIIFRDLFTRPVFSHHGLTPQIQTLFHNTAMPKLTEEIDRIINEFLSMAGKQYLQSDNAAKLNDNKVRSGHEVYIKGTLDTLAAKLQEMSDCLSSCGLHQMTI